MRQVRTYYYEGLASDDKPTGVKPNTVVKETDTGQTWITFDDGSNWVVADKRVRLVEEDGTFIDLPTLLEAITTAVEALGYEFTINGVNFNGYENIKMLTLDGDAEDDDPITLHDAGVDYQVDTGKVFIAFQALIWLEQTALIGRIGESNSADSAITKEVLKFSHGVQVPFMESCIGVFAADKYVTAETDSTSNNYQIKSGSVLYGIEVDA